MNGNFDINQTIQNILQMRSAGKNPQMIMQMLMQKNPQYRQLVSQMQNMSQGRNPRDFLTQLAKQNGVSEQNIAAIQQMFQ
jgi:hypothetical protein